MTPGQPREEHRGQEQESVLILVENSDGPGPPQRGEPRGQRPRRRRRTVNPSAPYPSASTPHVAAPTIGPIMVNANRSRSTVWPGSALESNSSGMPATLAPALYAPYVPVSVWSANNVRERYGSRRCGAPVSSHVAATSYLTCPSIMSMRPALVSTYAASRIGNTAPDPIRRAAEFGEAFTKRGTRTRRGGVGSRCRRDRRLRRGRAMAHRRRVYPGGAILPARNPLVPLRRTP